MRKGIILGLAALAAAGAAAAVLLGGKDEAEAPQAAPAQAHAAPVDPDKTVAFPLKNKYADYSRGENDPIYCFELDTPNGVKEVVVNAEQYETYYIGDEIICLEKGRDFEIV